MATLNAYASREDDLSLVEALMSDAWDYWDRQLRTPGTDRAKIARRLQFILFDMPERTRESEQKHLDRLQLSMVPSKAKHGSIEALIDELVDVPGNPIWVLPDDPRINAILNLGFDAIPVLIEHLDDERLTRSFADSPTDPTAYSYLVCCFARDILAEYIADDDFRFWGEQEISKEDKQAVKKWWEAAKKEGEEKYVVGRILRKRWKSDWPYPQLLKLIETKYPERLPEVIAAYLKATPKGMLLDPFVDALKRSSLPQATKDKVLDDVKEWRWGKLHY